MRRPEPVCGADDFSEKSVDIGGNRRGFIPDRFDFRHFSLLCDSRVQGMQVIEGHFLLAL